MYWHVTADVSAQGDSFYDILLEVRLLVSYLQYLVPTQQILIYCTGCEGVACSRRGQGVSCPRDPQTSPEEAGAPDVLHPPQAHLPERRPCPSRLSPPVSRRYGRVPPLQPGHTPVFRR